MQGGIVPFKHCLNLKMPAFAVKWRQCRRCRFRTRRQWNSTQQTSLVKVNTAAITSCNSVNWRTIRGDLWQRWLSFMCRGAAETRKL